MKRYISIVYLMLFGFFSLTGQCGINKWVDDNGRVHYSDVAAPDDTTSIKLRGATTAASGTVASDAEAPQSWAEREAELKKSKKSKAESAQKAAQKQEQADAKQKYCLDIRGSLKTLEESPRIATYDANGEQSYLDDAARQKRMDDAREAIKVNCS